MKKLFVIAAMSVVLLTGAGFADVRIETLSRVSMLAGIGDLEVSSKTEYQGDKSYRISNSRFVGGVMGAVAGGYTNSAEITRVDKGLAWEIYHGDATYYERPLVAPSYGQYGGGEASAEAKTESRGKYEVTNTELSVEHTGEKKDINGFPCEQHVVTYIVDMKDTEEGTELSQQMTADIWVTPMTDKLKKAQKAQTGFHKALLEYLGLDASPQDMERLGMNMMTSMYGVDPDDAQKRLNEVADELASIEGYPIVTDVKWKVVADEEEEPEPEPEVKEEKQSGGFPFPTSKGAMRGLVAKKIAGEIMEQAETKEPTEPEYLFTSRYEVKSVSVDDLPKTDFEIMEGYTPVTKPKR